MPDEVALEMTVNLCGRQRRVRVTMARNGRTDEEIVSVIVNQGIGTCVKVLPAKTIH